MGSQNVLAPPGPELRARPRHRPRELGRGGRRLLRGLGSHGGGVASRRRPLGRPLRRWPGPPSRASPRYTGADALVASECQARESVQHMDACSHARGTREPLWASSRPPPRSELCIDLDVKPHPVGVAEAKGRSRVHRAGSRRHRLRRQLEPAAGAVEQVRRARRRAEDAITIPSSVRFRGTTQRLCAWRGDRVE